MRRPSVGRLISLLLGATVVVLLTIDTTMACRFFLRHRVCDPCPVVAPCPAPVTCCTTAPSVVVVDSGCCGETIVDSCCAEGAVITDGCGAPCDGTSSAIESSLEAGPTPAPPVEQPGPAADSDN